MRAFSSSKKRILLLLGFLLAFLVVFNLSTYSLYKRAKAYLDNELGERLRSIAVILSHTVEIASPDTIAYGNIDASLYTLLHMVRAENLLSNIVILTNDGKTVVDLAHFSEPGEPNPFIELDYSAVTLARSGLPAYTSLYRSGGIYMKSAYAPITSQNDEISGIVGVEAGAAFFEVLRALSNAIILVDATSFAIIALLGFLFYRQSLSLDRVQEAVFKGENLAAMGRMVAGIAHEIRNPLSIIKTSAERIKKKYSLEDETFSYISEEVDQLDRILTGYLSFARAEDREFSEHSLQKILRRSALMLEGEIRQKGVTLEQHYPQKETVVYGDDRRIQQALLNVLLNALQAVENGGKIEIFLERASEFAVIKVRDNGCGIEQKDLKEITKPFFTTKKKGSGLGLSIVSNIVKDHKGKLDIKSAPGKGTEVTLSIPIAR